MSKNLAAPSHDPRYCGCVIVVVDPYSTGRSLVASLKEAGATLIAVQSSLQLADFWLRQLEPADFAAVVQFSTVEDTARKIRNFLSNTLSACAPSSIHAVVAGSEPGVVVAEQLQAVLGDPKFSNDAGTSSWRRHKFDQQARLRDRNLRAIRQSYCATAEEVRYWMEAADISFPIIVKPACSGGTDGVYWCHSTADIDHAFYQELNKQNCNGETNEKLLAQEFLRGTEFVVNSVSFKGRHVVTGLLRYKKHFDPAHNSITYESVEVIDACESPANLLIAYMHACLDALGFHFGASHGEVMLTETGPCLIEVGARLQGGAGPWLVQQATGTGCHEVLADVLVNEGKLFRQMLERNFRYVLKRRCVEFDLRNTQKEGSLAKDLDHDGQISSLPAVIKFSPAVNVGGWLPITRDMATSPGSVLLSHVRYDVVEETQQRLRQLESTGEIFDITSEEVALSPACFSEKSVSSSTSSASLSTSIISTEPSSTSTGRGGTGYFRKKPPQLLDEGMDSETSCFGKKNKTCPIMQRVESLSTVADFCSRKGSLADVEGLFV
ncbi:unnamed protein product [Amoebophrya sp. A120]|nr:unnamed protein product [Amoebophrya sp. A120]|eukprot:GSA120T00020801001.1